MFRLDDKIAIITGGSKGIGFAIAEAMAQAGAHVVLTARTEADLQTAVTQLHNKGYSAEYIVADVQNREACIALVQATYEKHGHIDILVNNAGMNIRRPALDLEPAAYEQIMATNLHGPFYLSQLVGQHMVAAQQGKIINIGSITSTYALSQAAAYGMTKGAIIQLTRSLATEWAASNVQVNAIAPGFILTDLNKKLWESNTELLNWALGNTPARRLGKPEDLGGVAVFLASSASDFVTGTVINVDGGFLSGGPWPIG